MRIYSLSQLFFKSLEQFSELNIVTNIYVSSSLIESYNFSIAQGIGAMFGTQNVHIKAERAQMAVRHYPHLLLQSLPHVTRYVSLLVSRDNQIFAMNQGFSMANSAYYAPLVTIECVINGVRQPY